MILSLIAVLVTALSSCDTALTPPPCRCPNLEEAVDSINWAPGVERQRSVTPPESGAQDDYLFVKRISASEEGQADRLVNRVSLALAEIGYDVTILDSGVTRAELGSMQIELSPLINWFEGLSGVRVLVLYRGEDSAQVVDEFEPLRAALAAS